MNRGLGIALIVVGVLLLAYGGFTFTTKDKVVDMGPVEITKDKKHSLPYAPLVGIGALVAGAVVMFTAKKG